MDWYFIGVDFGQTRDYTAIALLERAEVKGEFDYGVRAYARDVELRLRHLERIPLGTPYPEIVERVVKLTEDRRLSRHCHLAVDGTGVGRPVVDLLRKGEPEDRHSHLRRGSGRAGVQVAGVGDLPEN